MARHNKSGNAGSAFEIFTGIIALVGSLVPRIAQALGTLGAVCSFRAWSRAKGKHPIYFSRQALWTRSVFPRISQEENITILEFGVAFGEATSWWLSRLKSPSLRYYGFDLFTGLPRAWRNMPQHAFDAGGNTPSLNDNRITWIKGDVAETIQCFEFSQCVGKKFVIFDLDLFEPSLAVWGKLESQLREGDLVYFDEAFEMDERLLITAYMLPTMHFEILASCPLGLLMEYKN